MKNEFILTTPLYYANAAPHIGTAYTTILASVIANWQRLKNNKKIVLVTGTDEHGKKISDSAMAKNLSPQEFVDSNVLLFKESWERLEIKQDLFVRTTNKQHKEYVIKLFNKLLEQGDIYKGVQSGNYCVGCEEYKTTKDLNEHQKCPLHPYKDLQTYEEENWFFKLSKYEPEINNVIRNNLVDIQPSFYKQEIINFLDGGLKDFSISRKNLSWGIPVPNDPSQSLYVWFDALLGYTSHLDKDYPTINLHLLGKDILKFHAVYYIGMLVAAGLSYSNKTLLVNGFIVAEKPANKSEEDVKIGKSNNNSESLNSLLDELSVDAIKWWLVKEKQIGTDIKFNKEEIINVANVDFSDKIGNLINRLDKLVVKFPLHKAEMIYRNEDIISHRDNVLEQVVNDFDNYKFSSGLRKVVELAEYCNNQIEITKPWSLAKTSNSDYQSVVVSLYDCILSILTCVGLVCPTLVEQVKTNYDFDTTNDLKCFLVSSNTHNNKLFWSKFESRKQENET